MKLKPIVRYQLNDAKKPLIIFYGIIIVLFFSLSIIFKLTSNGKGHMDLSLGATACIFALIFGLNFFREHFYMMLQNGISRKTLFVGSVISILCLSLGMAVMESILSLLLNAIVGSGAHSASVTLLFEALYPALSVSMGAWLVVPINLLLMGIVYAVMISAGYLISLAFYKMNKAVVLLVSIGLPVLLVIIIPIIDTLLVGISLFVEIINFCAVILGVTTGLPILGFIVFLVLAAAISCGSYLMLRKTVVKN